MITRLIRKQKKSQKPRPGLNKESNGYGWIKLHRKIALTSFYKNGDAMLLAMHLLIYANFAKTLVTLHNNTDIVLLRGQYLGGYKRLAKELKWGLMRVRRAIKVLVNSGFLTQYYTNQYALLTICNYNSYQDRVSPRTPMTVQAEHPGVSTGEPMTVHSEHRNKNVKNVKKDKKKKETPIVDSTHFDKLWLMYPRKMGKDDAYRHMKSSLKTLKDVDDCARSITNYMNSDTYPEDKKYILMGSTFFHGRWKDFINNPEIEGDPKLKELQEMINASK